MLLAAAGRSVFASSTLAPPSQLTCDRQPAALAVQSSHPRLGWALSALSPGVRGVRQSAYRVVVSSSAALLASGKGDLWDSGRVASDGTLDVPYAGQRISSGQRVFWKVEVWDGSSSPSGWSAPASFTLAPPGWTAHWIAAAANTSEARDQGVTRPMPVFRKSFDVGRPVKRALLYISGLGQFEAHINGAKVGRAELAPGWTEYRKRVLYDTYDVTALLRTGTNTIGVLLGNGMFNVARTPGRYSKLVGSFGEPRLIAELRLMFRDGNEETFASGADWQVADGPITYSSTYGGEDYDARKVPAAWDRPGAVEPGAWNPASVIEGPGGGS